ncbi:uncharacterized protein LOC111393480 [Olea europaea var. sylvestris]|uniref:Uncharacterized protein n=1 Tax=Olea europaea subsp. europaea TaxID=158383 RepID=A0A8S0QJF9_OLEEU|nr:uncharacterized protein LOC111393480 [Olea europaea var. sylvestris]XP_022874793.1 uncharacterized protein LOC111393480 [Olea europaea var. sylvestris]CAA2966251.1 Hypothetical predicted protein [Olea europaea subsp. europaea]
MAVKCVQNFLLGAKHFRNRQNLGTNLRLVYYHSEERPHEEEEALSSEWYEKAFLKLTKLSQLLKNVDLIDGRLINLNDDSRIFDYKLEHKMQTLKSLVRAFIGCFSVQETMRKNLMTSFADDPRCREFQCFTKPSERDPITLSSLTKVADILNISAQQRKIVRHTICPQVTQHQIWTGALEDVLNGLKSEIDFLIHCCKRKEINLAQQIVASCKKLLDSAILPDPESTSWMRLMPTKGEDLSPSYKWEDVLEMLVDLINCLSEEKRLILHVTKLEVMKEGLYQIRDVLMDKNIGYREVRHQENLVQKKLTKALGHSSRCLFTLLLYYLHGCVKDIEVDVRGGVHKLDGENKFCLYMGKILTSDEEKAVQIGVKQLDRALGVFKFVMETAGMKGDLVLQGHLWCVGAENRLFPYRGNTYILHGINL